MKKDLQEKWNKVHLRELKDIEKGRNTIDSSKDSNFGKGSYISATRKNNRKSRNDRSQGGTMHHLTSQPVLKDQLSNGDDDPTGTPVHLAPNYDNDNYGDIDNLSKESPVFRIPSPLNQEFLDSHSPTNLRQRKSPNQIINEKGIYGFG